MANFRKIPPKVAITGGDGFVTRVSTVVDANLDEQRVVVIDFAKNFKKDVPPPEVFSLKNKIDSGVSLKEEDSVVFKSDSLSASELAQIDNVINSSDDDSVDDDSNS
ncbi:MAG: hypothetical protein J6T10_26920 [Methanobrevibacter sp.]|nr:hypothetical protein [Methanobrevibacter sp.]